MSSWGSGPVAACKHGLQRASMGCSVQAWVAACKHALQRANMGCSVQAWVAGTCRQQCMPIPGGRHNFASWSAGLLTHCPKCCTPKACTQAHPIKSTHACCEHKLRRMSSHQLTSKYGPLCCVCRRTAGPSCRMTGPEGTPRRVLAGAGKASWSHQGTCWQADTRRYKENTAMTGTVINASPLCLWVTAQASALK